MERLAPEHRDVHNYYQPADVVFKDARSFITANGDLRDALCTPHGASRSLL